MKILVGSDYHGFDLKTYLLDFLREKYPDAEIVDSGTYDNKKVDDYNDAALEVARGLKKGSAEDRGILICGSGHGMTMQANRFKGIRAALCATPESAEMAREHDDANILCLAGSTTEPIVAEEIVIAFLDTEFPSLDRRERRVRRLDEEGTDA